MDTVVVHGGAGTWKDTDHVAILELLSGALESGMSVLGKGDSALDAVVTAVEILENNPHFNAGTGSCLNLEGNVEMDAAVMRGRDLEAGGVTNITSVRNPIRVAREVMERTDHVLIGGEGATTFARRCGFESYDPVTEERRDQYQRRKQDFLDGVDDFSLPKLQQWINDHPEWMGGTVGAVALSSTGHVASATSTGGVFLKWPGRIGDTPLVGAGTYANGDAAASATGRGEFITRYLTTRQIAERVSRGETPSDAVDCVLSGMSRSVGDHVGAISIDTSGQIGIDHKTPRMPHGWIRQGESPVVAMEADG